MRQSAAMNLDWLIVGGGIHGVHIAIRLLREAQVDRRRLRIVDPSARLLERWRSCTEVTGMRHLRSPAVHNLDVSPWSLREYADARGEDKTGQFARPYDRPDLQLFNDHCDELIRSLSLDALHVRALALRCSVDCDAATVELSDGTTVAARNVVLAMGAGDQPRWPAWAPKGHPSVRHVFAPEFDDWPSNKETVVVVGGGITGGQIALRLVAEGHTPHLVSRHALREHQFDSDPGWLGPKLMKGFQRERNLDKRRDCITRARHRGSVPPSVHRALRAAIRRGDIVWHQDEVHALDADGSDWSLRLRGGGAVSASRVLLATGFGSQRPGGALVDTLIESASLPCAKCGYPIVDRSLRWHPRVCVAGPLAELELGPSSRNIAGARRAADRLIAAERRARRSA